MRRTFFVCVLAALSVVGVSAQEERRQAVITNGQGSPKCTIEVEVDVVADVEIQGTVARLHTLSGSRATWRRFECNQPMPMNPANFSFRGIDGRGRQTLIGDPGRSGTAVVRIEDPKAGREGYTFDLEWQGSGGPTAGAPGYGPGFPQSQRQGPLPDGDRDRDRGRDHDRQFGADEATRQCVDAARDQLRSSGYSDSKVIEVKMDGQPGRGDWIYGTIAGQRGPRAENFGFGCSVDFQGHRIGAVNMRPANDGYYGGDTDHNRYDHDRAFRACGEAVQERLSHDGYGDFRMGKMDMDNRPGNNNWVVGGLAARRGDYSDDFQFSCLIDFDGGRVRSINVNRR